MRVHRTTQGIAFALLACFTGCGEDDANQSDGGSTGADAAAMGGEADAGNEADAGGESELDRSAYTDVGTDAPLDYSVPEMWLCRPDIEDDECHRTLDATEIRADGSREVEEHTVASEPEFDCFYVYPTVLLSGEPQMVDFSQTGVDMVNDPLQSQGARFSSMCRTFAPFYRQVGLSNGEPVEGSDGELAVQDVRDAFEEYMENWNQGRDFVLIGHSQGTRMLTLLLQMDIDPDPALREQMISALLIGGNVRVPKDDVVGGDFQNVPLCTEPGQRGCVIAYVSYADDDAPTESDLFGQDPSETERVACVNPAVLAGNTGLYASSYFSTKASNPTFAPDDPLPDDLETPFAVFHDVFRGECVEENGFSYLRVSLELSGEDDMRLPPWRVTAVEEAGFGLHLMDFHIPMSDLLEAVSMQASTE